ncbi:MAG: hypothetical protein H6510_08420 [Acidobacteria bacterium]|nr:hypothetical protein [Acidobacteriota bacterium]MCB9397825.1 hypothetical protein [Acidobacteriota bacterium]
MIGFVLGSIFLFQNQAAISSPSFDQSGAYSQGVTFVAEANPFVGTSFAWSTSNGQTGTGNSFFFQASEPGTYTVSMVATFPDGSKSTPDTRILYLNQDGIHTNGPKIEFLEADNEAVHPNELITITPHFVDPDFTPPYRFHWFYLNNQRPVRVETEILQLRSPANPDLLVSLIMEDGDGHISSFASLPITVKEGNLPPNGRITSAKDATIVRIGNQIHLEASGTDPENDVPLTFEWQLFDGPNLVTRTGSSLDYTFSDKGFSPLYLTAIDSKGNRDPSPQLVQVYIYDGSSILDAIFINITHPDFLSRHYVNDSVFLAGSVIAGNSYFQGHWQVKNLLSSQPADLFEGNNPGRYQFSEPGFYQIKFDAEVGELDYATYAANRLYLGVQNRLDNLPPVVYFDPYDLIVSPDNATITFEPEVSDPEDDAVTLFWVANGEYMGTGEEKTFTFSMKDQEKSQGFAYRFVYAYARDEQGNFSIFPAGRTVFLYNRNQPLRGQISGQTRNTTLFVPTGSSFDPSGSVINPSQVPFLISWIGTYESENAFFYSELADPPAFSFPKPGAVSLSFVPYSSEALTVETGNLYFLVYDPQLRPQVTITKPIANSLRAELGSTLTFEGTYYEPNTYRTIGVQQISNQLTWTVSRPDGVRESFAQNDGLDYTFTQTGTYTFQLSSTNSVGISSANLAQASVLVSPPQADPFEPNDTRETAANLNLGNYANLSVGPNDPIDWYRFDLASDGAAIELLFNTSQSSGAVNLEIFYNQQTVVKSVLASGTQTPYTFFGSKKGTYFLKLSAPEGANKDGLSFGVGVSTTNPRLIFPYPKEDAVDSTLLSVVNPYSVPAKLIFEARDPQGLLLANYSTSLNPNGRIEKAIKDLFPSVESPNISWVRVQSDASVYGLSYTVARDLKTGVAEPAFIGALDELVVPHIAQATHQWFTHAAIVNNSAGSGAANFATQGGLFPVTQVNTAFSRSLIDFLAFWGGTLPFGTEWGRFEHQTGQSVLAGMEIFGKIDGNFQAAGLNLSSLKVRNPNHFYIDRDIYFPHIAKDVANFWTGIAFVNTSNDMAPILLRAYDDSGQLIAETSENLPAQAKRVDLAQNFFPQVPSNAGISWLELKTTGAVQGYELFGSNDGTNRRLAGLQAITGGAKELIFPKILNEANKFYTGIAILNLERSASAQLQYTVYDDAGQTVASLTRTVGPGQKEVVLASALFPNLAATARWMRVTASQPIAGFALFGDTSGEFLSGSIAQ